MADVTGNLLEQSYYSSDGEVLRSSQVCSDVLDDVYASADGERSSSPKSGASTQETYPRRVIIVPLEQGD